MRGRYMYVWGVGEDVHCMCEGVCGCGTLIVVL